MYPDNETTLSRIYLEKVIAALDEPICLIGGWAIRYTVNERFQERFSRDYLGSRDIDLGFHVNPNATEEELRKSGFINALKTLEKEGFQNVSFRLVKNIDQEGKELSSEEQRKLDSHKMVQMYVDLLVDNRSDDLGKICKMTIADEPMVSFAFDNEKNKVNLKDFRKRVFVPSPGLLLATKLYWMPSREKDHKRLKDIYDIIALIAFTKNNYTLLEEACKFLGKKRITSTIQKITESDRSSTEEMLGLGKGEATAILAGFLQNIDAANYVDKDKIDSWTKMIRHHLQHGENEQLYFVINKAKEHSGWSLFPHIEFRKEIFSLIELDPAPQAVLRIVLQIILDQLTASKEYTMPTLLEHKKIIRLLEKGPFHPEITNNVLQFIFLLEGNDALLRKITNMRHDNWHQFSGQFNFTQIRSMTEGERFDGLIDQVREEHSNEKETEKKARLKALYNHLVRVS